MVPDEVPTVAQRLGSALVRLASNTKVPDAPSGFRAMSAATARRLDVYNDYTYTLETLIQAGRSGLDVQSVPISVNGQRRPSRLMRWWPFYVIRSCATILRIAVMYRPFRFFSIIGGVLGALGAALLGRFAVLYLMGHGNGHVQSLVIGTALLAVATQVTVTGFLADSLAANSRLLRDLRDHVDRLDTGERHTTSRFSTRSAYQLVTSSDAASSIDRPLADLSLQPSRSSSAEVTSLSNVDSSPGERLRISS